MGYFLKTSFWHKSGLALYAIVFLFVGIVLSIFFFFPQYFSMQSGIYNISCREIRSKISAAVEEHNAVNSVSITHPGKRIDVDTLKEKGFLADVRNCPSKGTYSFDSNGKVICTVHLETNKN